MRSSRTTIEGSSLPGKRLVWIDRNDFCGFACARCSWRFAVPGLRNSDGLPVELARSRFDQHDCADYWVTSTALIAVLEEAVANLGKVVDQFTEGGQRAPLEPKLQSVAADCEEIRLSLSRILTAVKTQ